MLRVRVELIPDGDEARASVLGELEISNDGTGSNFTGNYNVKLKEFSRSILGDPEVYKTFARIYDVERDIARPMQVVGIALSVVAPVKRTMSSNVYSWGEIVQRGA